MEEAPPPAVAAEASPAAEALPTINAVAALTRLPQDQLLERLDLPEHVRQALSTPEGESLAARELYVAMQRCKEIIHEHSRFVRDLRGRGLGSVTKPDGEHSEEWSSIDGKRYFTHQDFPELAAMQRALREEPRTLAQALIRAVERQLRPLPQESDGARRR